MVRHWHGAEQDYLRAGSLEFLRISPFPLAWRAADPVRLGSVGCEVYGQERANQDGAVGRRSTGSRDGTGAPGAGGSTWRRTARCCAKPMMVTSSPTRTMKVPMYAEVCIVLGFSPNLATAKPSPANETAVRM